MEYYIKANPLIHYQSQYIGYTRALYTTKVKSAATWKRLAIASNISVDNFAIVEHSHCPSILI